MILSDRDILAAMERGEIEITPFQRDRLGPNSYDVHLSRHLLMVDYTFGMGLDVRCQPLMMPLEMSESGFQLFPGKLYLGSTVERTVTRKHVPFLEGRSSTGRLGISIHATAGKGDVGFSGHWTMEISVIEPVRIVPGMRIGQILFHEVSSPPDLDYSVRSGSHYSFQSKFPMPSRMHESKFMRYDET